MQRNHGGLLMEPLFLHDFGNKEEVLDAFNIKEEDLDGAEIIVASYTYKNYSGSAWVLLRRGAALFEVNGGHCSCYGLSGQWEMEETSIAALKSMLEGGRFGRDYYGRNEFATELGELLHELEFGAPKEGKTDGEDEGFYL